MRNGRGSGFELPEGPVSGFRFPVSGFRVTIPITAAFVETGELIRAPETENGRWRSPENSRCYRIL